MAVKWRLPLIENERYAFIPPTDEDVAHVVANLREADRMEHHAQFGHHRYADGVRLSMLASDDVVVAVAASGEPVAVLGIVTVSALYAVGCPWMVATDRAFAYRRAFIEAGRTYTAAMLEEFESLTNYVDVRNARAIAWLRRLGFQFEPAEPYGETGLPFHRFHIDREGFHVQR